jgi:hypothetical protein
MGIEEPIINDTIWKHVEQSKWTFFQGCSQEGMCPLKNVEPRWKHDELDVNQKNFRGSKPFWLRSFFLSLNKPTANLKILMRAKMRMRILSNHYIARSTQHENQNAFYTAHTCENSKQISSYT